MLGAGRLLSRDPRCGLLGSSCRHFDWSAERARVYCAHDGGVRFGKGTATAGEVVCRNGGRRTGKTGGRSGVIIGCGEGGAATRAITKGARNSPADAGGARRSGMAARSGCATTI